MLKRENMYAYQTRAVNFIREKRKCALFLDMGLGKTATTLTAISDALSDFDISRVLIIAPLRVANSVWKQEAANWSHLQHLDIGIATGALAKRREVINAKHDITIINRENIQWLVADYKKWDFDCVIIDESTSFKNASSKRFKALKSVLKHMQYTVLLTGTPSPQGYIDLWSQLYLIDGGARLGRTKTNFLNLYYTSMGFKGYEYRLITGADRVIKEKIKDICLTMQSEDYLELPDRIYIDVKVTMPDAIKKQYKEFKNELLMELESGQTIVAPSAATLNNRLLQMCNGAIYLEEGGYEVLHDEKIEALKEILENNPDENILVAYNYKSDKERLLKAFPFAVELDKEGYAVGE